MDIPEKDILQILTLFEESHFEFLTLNYGDLKLSVSKSGYLPESADSTATSSHIEANNVPELPQGQSAAVATASSNPKTSSPTPIVETAETADLVAIKAPVVGTFYASPEPGAPPYVKVGTQVEEDTTVGLVEVMKVYNSVKSGVTGTVEKILVENAQFVEHGQALIMVRPTESGKA